MTRRLSTLFTLAGLLIAAASNALTFVGNTGIFQSGFSFPRRGGFIDQDQSLTVTTETYPIESGQQVTAVVTTNNWQSTQEYEFTFDYNIGNNSKWFLVLPQFPKGSQVQFYLRAARSGQTVYDSNSGGNFGYYERFTQAARRGPILQWFATPYKTIIKRLPEVVKAGYSAIYLPAPQKSGGGTFSSGYNPVDRFDLGDRLQLGTVRTNFGTTNELIELIKLAHRFDIEIYCDLVLNHNANRADFAISRYPDMLPEDFHIFSSANTGNNEINFNNESSFSFGMMNHDLVGLADIAQEDGNNVASNLTLPAFASFNANGKPSFIRTPTVPQSYPGETPAAEDVDQYLERWVRYLTDVIGFDGFRLDAVKHMPPGYLGWTPDQAASQGFTHGNLIPRMMALHPNLVFFGEDLTTDNYELREYSKTGLNPLDFPLFYNLKSFLTQNGFGNIGSSLANSYGVDASTGLSFLQGGLSSNLGVSFIQSHDDGPPTSNNLGYAFILGRPGRAQVYYDGNNIQPGNWSNFPRPGRFDALGNGDDYLTRLVDASTRFGRGYSVNRSITSDLYIFERQIDGKGIAIIGLNDRGDTTPLTASIQTAFQPGTVLTDLTGQSPSVTVQANGTASITVPGNGNGSEPNNGRGYVFYVPVAPTISGSLPPVQMILPSGSAAAVSTYSTPGGTYSSGQSFQAASVSAKTASLLVQVTSNAASAYVKIDDGEDVAAQPPLSNTPEGLTDGFVPLIQSGPGVFRLNNADLSGLSDGLHLARVRAFVNTNGWPGVFQDFPLFFTIQRGLGSRQSIDGDLTDFNTPLSVQTKNPTSNSNRVDALYVSNDDQYLYIGLAGRVDTGENLTNGISLFMDADGSSSTGLRTTSDLADDSGPAPRLLSSHALTMPTGFGADFALSSFRMSGTSMVTDAPFNGGIEPALYVGAQAGVFKINPSRLQVLEPVSALIAGQNRINKTDPAKGVEAAIPLKSIYPNGIPATGGPNFVAFMSTTGEANSFLLSTDPLRATLGGRPAPHGWTANQVLPSQSNIGPDPGTNAYTALASVHYGITVAQVASGVSIQASKPKLDPAKHIYFADVTIKNGSFGVRGPLALRMSLPNGVVLLTQTSESVVVPGAVCQALDQPMLTPGQSVQVHLEFTANSGFTISPTLLTGPGAR